MPKRRSLATVKDIKVGQVVYLTAKEWPIEKQIIIRGRIARVYIDPSISPYPFFTIEGNRLHSRSTADVGVIGCQYDDRPCQVFLNARSANHWLKMWKNRNPNFIDRHAGCLTFGYY